MKARALAFLATIGCLCAISAVPADARAARAPRPTIYVSKTVVLQSDPVTITGNAHGKLSLYRKAGKSASWHRITAVRNRYRVTVRPEPATANYYRVGTSRTVRVTSTACAPLARQGRVAHGWFNARGKTSDLATNWGRLICSAAPGATIRLAVMFVWAGRYADSLVQLLRLVSAYRRVHVHVLVQRSRYEDAPVSNPRSWTRLQRSFSFARLNWCQRACTVPDPDPATPYKFNDMHYKFMTVSRTVWGRTAVVESTLNWSPQQFGRQYGSAIFFHDEPRLYDAFVQAYGAAVRKKQATAADLDSRAWRATGPRIAYTFDPSSLSADPISAELETLRCHAGDRISVVNANVTRGRLVRQLNRLHGEGCTVRVITQGAWAPSGIQYTVRHMATHDKYVLVHAHNESDGAVDEVISGSENYRPDGMQHSDEQLVRVRNTSVVHGFDAWFTHEWSVST